MFAPQCAGSVQPPQTAWWSTILFPCQPPTFSMQQVNVPVATPLTTSNATESSPPREEMARSRADSCSPAPTSHVAARTPYGSSRRRRSVSWNPVVHFMVIPAAGDIADQDRIWWDQVDLDEFRFNERKRRVQLCGLGGSGSALLELEDLEDEEVEEHKAFFDGPARRAGQEDDGSHAEASTRKAGLGDIERYSIIPEAEGAARLLSPWACRPLNPRTNNTTHRRSAGVTTFRWHRHLSSLRHRNLLSRRRSDRRSLIFQSRHRNSSPSRSATLCLLARCPFCHQPSPARRLCCRARRALAITAR